MKSEHWLFQSIPVLILLLSFYALITGDVIAAVIFSMVNIFLMILDDFNSRNLEAGK